MGSRIWPAADAWVILLLGIASRSWLLFSTPLVPGVNGAYYLVQARALLERGQLGIPDFPLTFYLAAAVARIYQAMFRVDLEAAVVAATKLTDAVVPPLAALPVYLIVRAWGKSTLVHWTAAGAAAVVAMGGPALSMVGEFQKNSLALAGLSWFLYAAWRLLDSEDGAERVRAYATALLSLGFIGVTHVGVFGSTLVVGVGLLGARILSERSVPIWQAIQGAAPVAILIAAAAAVAAQFDPERVDRLLHVYSGTAQILTFGADPMPMGPAGLILWTPWFLLAGLISVGIRSAWRKRQVVGSASQVAIGCAAAVLALTGPWFSPDTVIRLALNAVIPAVLAIAFWVIHSRVRWIRMVLGALPCVVLLGAGGLRVASGGEPVIGMDLFHDLLRARDVLRNSSVAPDRTLVVSFHGMEWWSAWVLQTRVAQPQALSREDWARFEQVLFLEAKEDFRLPGPPMPQQEMASLPEALRPVAAPAGAVTVYESRYLRLARVAVAPDSVPSSP